MCYGGKGVEQDEKLVVMWFQKAAEQNDAQVQIALEGMCSDGTEVEQTMDNLSDGIIRLQSRTKQKPRIIWESYIEEGLGVEQKYKEVHIGFNHL